MKAKLFILLTFTFLTITSQAQETGAPDKPTEKILPQRLARFDLNHDGRLDEQELANEKATVEKEIAAFEKKLEKNAKAREALMLRKYDLNKNKILDADELAAVKAQNAERAEVLKKFDTNKDGVIDDKEFIEFTKSLVNESPAKK